jgi:N-formylglutamate amidohydrolase
MVDPEAPCTVIRDPRQPLITSAIHAGHALRPEVRKLLAVPDEQRRREEDPFTDRWTVVAPSRLIGTVSRFEVDLNRPREGAVYRVPDDAWGISVWRQPPPEDVIARSLARYDAFYAAAAALFDAVHDRFGRFVVLDLHSYNHRRDGPGAPPAPAQSHPDVNLGTSTMDLTRFGCAVERFAEALRAGAGRPSLDVRADVKFRGGHFVRWIHDRYPGAACAIAVEFKKTFMDEWTGQPDEARISAITDRLTDAVPVLLAELERDAA